MNATVDHGILRLSNGTTREVGNTTSALQGVMDTVFARPVLPNATALAWFNSSVFSTLTVRGTYKADVTLRLASFFILDLDNAIISAASSVTGAVVSMNATRFAVVRGGTVTCAEWNGNRTATQVIGIEAINAPYTLLDSVTVTSCGIGNTANIHIRGEPFFSFAEIRNVTCVASEVGKWCSFQKKLLDICACNHLFNQLLRITHSLHKTGPRHLDRDLHSCCDFGL